jgi:hypothetical protein
MSAASINQRLELQAHLPRPRHHRQRVQHLLLGLAPLAGGAGAGLDAARWGRLAVFWNGMGHLVSSRGAVQRQATCLLKPWAGHDTLLVADYTTLSPPQPPAHLPAPPRAPPPPRPPPRWPPSSAPAPPPARRPPARGGAPRRCGSRRRRCCPRCGCPWLSACVYGEYMGYAMSACSRVMQACSLFATCALIPRTPKLALKTKLQTRGPPVGKDKVQHLDVGHVDPRAAPVAAGRGDAGRLQVLGGEGLQVEHLLVVGGAGREVFRSFCRLAKISCSPTCQQQPTQPTQNQPGTNPPTPPPQTAPSSSGPSTRPPPCAAWRRWCTPGGRCRSCTQTASSRPPAPRRRRHPRRRRRAWPGPRWGARAPAWRGG